MNNDSKTWLADNSKAQFIDSLNVSASNNKRTRRSKNTNSVSQETTLPPKKYQTTNKKDKALLLAKIRKIVDPESHDETWYKTVRKYKPSEYRALLSQLYPKLIDSEIRLKWKNIKRMLDSIGKSDGRGGALLVTEEEKNEFKRHLEDVIKNQMKTRSFKVLRKHVLPKIQEIFANNGRKLPKKPFKKHFWSYYLKEEENLEVKVAWKKLPRTKPRVSSKDDSDSSFISDMMDKSECNDDDNNLSIFEEDDVNNEGKILFEEVKEVDIGVKRGDEWPNFDEDKFNNNDFKEFIPVEEFSNEDFFFLKMKEFLGKEKLEVSYVGFDNDLMNFFDK